MAFETRRKKIRFEADYCVEVLFSNKPLSEDYLCIKGRCVNINNKGALIMLKNSISPLYKIAISFVTDYGNKKIKIPAKIIWTGAKQNGFYPSGAEFLPKNKKQRNSICELINDVNKKNKNKVNNGIIYDKRRKKLRVKFNLPSNVIGVSDNINSNNGRSSILNINENGLKLRTVYSLEKFVNIHIKLPPCYSDNPEKASGIDMKGIVKWSYSVNKSVYIYGIIFTDCSDESRKKIKSIISYEADKARGSIMYPKIEIKRVPHSCNMYGVDFTIGCENECAYCHFASIIKDKWEKKYPDKDNFPVPVDISPIYNLEKFPETVVYLSPSSDPFAPIAKDLTHEFLKFMLPKGVIFTIATKNIIPDRTIKLLKKYSNQIEAIGISVTNINPERNRILEPNSPSADERINQIPKLKEIGCCIGARMDPLFPLIDDTDENIHSVVKRLANVAADHITATYVFTFGKYKAKLEKKPFLKKAIKLLKEKSYVIAGAAYSPPLDYKRKKYEKIYDVCKKYNIQFSTCGCKEVRLEKENYSLICRNINFYNKRK